MDNTIAKLTDVINNLIESNDKNYNEGNGVYQGDYLERYSGGYQDGYLDGYHDALVDVLNQMRIEHNHTYYN